MKIKSIIITILLIFVVQNSAIAKTNSAEKFQRGADIYFKITDRLDLSLRQQRKAFGIKMEEMYHLAPLMAQINENEHKLNELYKNGGSSDEIDNLAETLRLQKALASQKKRYYVGRYRGILDEEQNHKLDELIFDLANGYLKL